MNILPHRSPLSSYLPGDLARMTLSELRNHVIPIVIEQEGRMERSYDIYSRLLKDRIIFLGSEIDPYNQVSNSVIAQFLFLQMQDPQKDVNLYINSPGGSVSAGLAIYDTMQFVTCDINTYVIGMAASMGAVLLCAGTKGKRFALPNSDIMIHQVSGGAHGTASDVERSVNHMFKLKKRLNHIIARHTGQPVERVEKDADRDHWMGAEEALSYGLVDKILEHQKDASLLTPVPGSGPAPEPAPSVPPNPT